MEAPNSCSSCQSLTGKLQKVHQKFSIYKIKCNQNDILIDTFRKQNVLLKALKEELALKDTALTDASNKLKFSEVECKALRQTLEKEKEDNKRRIAGKFEQTDLEVTNLRIELENAKTLLDAQRITHSQLTEKFEEEINLIKGEREALTQEISGMQDKFANSEKIVSTMSQKFKSFSLLKDDKKKLMGAVMRWIAKWEKDSEAASLEAKLLSDAESPKKRPSDGYGSESDVSQQRSPQKQAVREGTACEMDSSDDSDFEEVTENVTSPLKLVTIGESAAQTVANVKKTRKPKVSRKSPPKKTSPEKKCSKRLSMSPTKSVTSVDVTSVDVQSQPLPELELSENEGDGGSYVDSEGDGHHTSIFDFENGKEQELPEKACITSVLQDASYRRGALSPFPGTFLRGPVGSRQKLDDNTPSDGRPQSPLNNISEETQLLVGNAPILTKLCVICTKLLLKCNVCVDVVNRFKDLKCTCDELSHGGVRGLDTPPSSERVPNEDRPLLSLTSQNQGAFDIPLNPLKKVSPEGMLVDFVKNVSNPIQVNASCQTSKSVLTSNFASQTVKISLRNLAVQTVRSPGRSIGIQAVNVRSTIATQTVFAPTVSTSTQTISSGNDGKLTGNSTASQKPSASGKETSSWLGDEEAGMKSRNKHMFSRDVSVQAEMKNISVKAPSVPHKPVRSIRTQTEVVSERRCDPNSCTMRPFFQTLQNVVNQANFATNYPANMNGYANLYPAVTMPPYFGAPPPFFPANMYYSPLCGNAANVSSLTPSEPLEPDGLCGSLKRHRDGCIPPILKREDVPGRSSSEESGERRTASSSQRKSRSRWRNDRSSYLPNRKPSVKSRLNRSQSTTPGKRSRSKKEAVTSDPSDEEVGISPSRKLSRSKKEALDSDLSDEDIRIVSMSKKKESRGFSGSSMVQESLIPYKKRTRRCSERRIFSDSSCTESSAKKRFRRIRQLSESSSEREQEKIDHKQSSPKLIKETPTSPVASQVVRPTPSCPTAQKKQAEPKRTSNRKPNSAVFEKKLSAAKSAVRFVKESNPDPYDHRENHSSCFSQKEILPNGNLQQTPGGEDLIPQKRDTRQPGISQTKFTPARAQTNPNDKMLILEKNDVREEVGASVRNGVKSSSSCLVSVEKKGLLAWQEGDARKSNCSVKSKSPRSQIKIDGKEEVLSHLRKNEDCVKSKSCEDLTETVRLEGDAQESVESTISSQRDDLLIRPEGDQFDFETSVKSSEIQSEDSMTRPEHDAQKSVESSSVTCSDPTTARNQDASIRQTSDGRESKNSLNLTEPLRKGKSSTFQRGDLQKSGTGESLLLVPSARVETGNVATLEDDLCLSDESGNSSEDEDKFVISEANVGRQDSKLGTAEPIEEIEEQAESVDSGIDLKNTASEEPSIEVAEKLSQGQNDIAMSESKEENSSASPPNKDSTTGVAKRRMPVVPVLSTPPVTRRRRKTETQVASKTNMESPEKSPNPVRTSARLSHLKYTSISTLGSKRKRSAYDCEGDEAKKLTADKERTHGSPPGPKNGREKKIAKGEGLLNGNSPSTECEEVKDSINGKELSVVKNEHSPLSENEEIMVQSLCSVSESECPSLSPASNDNVGGSPPRRLRSRVRRVQDNEIQTPQRRSLRTRSASKETLEKISNAEENSNSSVPDSPKSKSTVCGVRKASKLEKLRSTVSRVHPLIQRVPVRVEPPLQRAKPAKSLEEPHPEIEKRVGSLQMPKSGRMAVVLEEEPRRAKFEGQKSKMVRTVTPQQKPALPTVLAKPRITPQDRIAVRQPTSNASPTPNENGSVEPNQPVTLSHPLPNSVSKPTEEPPETTTAAPFKRSNSLAVRSRLSPSSSRPSTPQIPDSVTFSEATKVDETVPAPAPSGHPSTSSAPCVSALPTVPQSQLGKRKSSSLWCEAAATYEASSGVVMRPSIPPLRDNSTASTSNELGTGRSLTSLIDSTERATNYSEKIVHDDSHPLLLAWVKNGAQFRINRKATSMSRNDIIASRTAMKKIINHYLASAYVTEELLSATVNSLLNPKLICTGHIIARFVVDNVEQDYDGLVCPDGPGPSRYLTKVQQQLIALVMRVFPKYPSIVSDILQIIGFRMFRLGKRPEGDRVVWLARMHTCFCRIMKWRSSSYIFCYDAMYCYVSCSARVVLAVFEIWPELLPHGISFEKAGINAQVLMHFIMTQGSPTANFEQDLKFLRALFVSKKVYSGHTNSLALTERIINEMKEKNNPDLTPAMILIAKRESIAWAQEHIVNRQLLPIVGDWIVDGEKTKATLPVTAAWTLCAIVRAFRGSEITVKTTMTLMRSLLLDNKADCPALEHSACAGLVSLARHDVEFVADVLKEWKPKHRPPIWLVDLLLSLINNKSRPLSWWHQHVDALCNPDRVLNY